MELDFVKMFQLAGYDEATAQKAMVAVMNIETRLAKAAQRICLCDVRKLS